MTKNKEVDAWLKACDNPLKPVVAAVREVILKAVTRVTEAIKWQAPTVIYKGNIARFHPKAKNHASLMFHKGAVIPGDFFSNLVGNGKEARSFKVAGLDDLEAKADELAASLLAWCEMKDGG